jgi:hypothetical protein
MRRSQQRKSTASPTSHQQSRPKTLPQPMGRSVLVKPRRLTASLMKLQQMERNVVVRMMRPRSHQQRRLIPSLRLLSMPHDTPPHPLVVFSMHCQGCFTGVYLGGWSISTKFSCILILLWQSGLGLCEWAMNGLFLTRMVARVHTHTHHKTMDFSCETFYQVITIHGRVM